MNLSKGVSSNSSMLVNDVNTDGYPDLLVSVMNGGSVRSYLYFNVECEGCKNGRGFEYNSVFDVVKNVEGQMVTASFFDLGEDGAVDIVLNVKKNSTSSFTLVTFMNNLKEDSFFIKALPLSSFSSSDDDRMASVFGTTFQWRITTL